jgi:hypothetical protein
MFGRLTRWRSAIVRQPARDLTQQSLGNADLVWLPDPGRWSFRADPFGLWRNGHLYVFVERFDYIDPRGRIEVLTYDRSLQLVCVEEALSEPWHLSYPFVFEADGATWMLPEAAESGRLTLYRCNKFPASWEPELAVPVEGALDATPLHWKGRWWLFYAVRQKPPQRGHELHIAYCDRIGGAWTQHRLNPVRAGLEDCRPAGTPLANANSIDLPVQDARNSYGGAVQRLRITILDEHRFEAETHSWLSPPPNLAPFKDGLHTISSADSVSLIDLKQIDGSLAARLYKSFSLG